VNLNGGRSFSIVEPNQVYLHSSVFRTGLLAREGPQVGRSYLLFLKDRMRRPGMYYLLAKSQITLSKHVPDSVLSVL